MSWIKWEVVDQPTHSSWVLQQIVEKSIILHPQCKRKNRQQATSKAHELPVIALVRIAKSRQSLIIWPGIGPVKTISIDGPAIPGLLRRIVGGLVAHSKGLNPIAAGDPQMFGGVFGQLGLGGGISHHTLWYFTSVWRSGLLVRMHLPD